MTCNTDYKQHECPVIKVINVSIYFVLVIYEFIILFIIKAAVFRATVYIMLCVSLSDGKKEKASERR